MHKITKWKINNKNNILIYKDYKDSCFFQLLSARLTSIFSSKPLDPLCSTLHIDKTCCNIASCSNKVEYSSGTLVCSQCPKWTVRRRTGRCSLTWTHMWLANRVCSTMWLFDLSGSKFAWAFVATLPCLVRLLLLSTY
jgi:hypothetical protein